MAGTLTAAFSIGASSTAPFSGDSALTGTTSQVQLRTADTSSEGYLDAITVEQGVVTDGNLGSEGALTAVCEQIYTVDFNKTGGGTYRTSPNMFNNFVPYDDTATRGTTTLRIGTKGCWITLKGGGGKGGNGFGSVADVRGGGAGGGGGARVNRSWIPRSQLGTTYSCIEGGAGLDSSFTSGGKTVTANSGSQGGTGSSTNIGGAGGTVSTGGFTGLSTTSGGKGGDGGSTQASNDPGGSPDGGGAGGVGPLFTGSNNGLAGNGTGGDGGQGRATSNGLAGGAGGVGGGGGGGGGGNPSGGTGGNGGAGSLLIEWE